jgi:tRNA-2-methylthio-N6-dimethylallyladenosine synthase
MRYLIQTWGCQMNTHDSEKLAGILEGLGHTPALNLPAAELLLLNTCSIREKAEEKVFSLLGTLRPLKEKRPDLIVGLCGCVAQREGEGVFRRSDLVDFVLGPRAIASLPAILEQVKERRGRPVDLQRREDSIQFDGALAKRAGGPRAFITVMEGCNKTCTYCVVPTTRGKEISKPARAVLAEASHLAGQGYLEIELLGQNVNAYRDGQVHLDGLLRMLQRVEGIRRLRFTTSHPAHLSNAIILAMRECPTVCPSLHLPVQSGSDSVLARMRRGYTRRRYLDRVERLRRLIPDIALSTDIIVGYPGETDGEFGQSLSLLQEVQFDQVYSFVYSPRPGTDALQHPEDLSRSDKEARLHELQALQQDIQRSRNSRLIGSEIEVLVDGLSRMAGESRLRGRSESNRVVNFAGPARLMGEFIRVRVEAAGPNSLEGRRMGPPGS